MSRGGRRLDRQSTRTEKSYESPRSRAGFCSSTTNFHPPYSWLTIALRFRTASSLDFSS